MYRAPEEEYRRESRPRDKKQVMEELKQILCSRPVGDLPKQAFKNLKSLLPVAEELSSLLKRYCHDRYRFYFTYSKYEREIRGMIYTPQTDRKAEQGLQEVINMGAMPNPQAVILLMGTVAQMQIFINILFIIF